MSENHSQEQQNEDSKQKAQTDEQQTETTADDAGQTPAQASSKENQLDEIQQQLEKAQSSYLYLRADFENYKKQMIKERSDYLKYGAERLVTAFLDILDNFDRALSVELDPTNKDSIESFRKGMEMTASEFKSTLKKFSVEEVECKGQPFDPNLHEALGSEETDQIPAGHISQVFKAAYKLHDRVIRPAQVIVAKAKEKA